MTLRVLARRSVDVLLSRLAERKGDPSDATAAVLLAQAARDCGESWHQMDAESDPADTCKTMLAAWQLDAGAGQTSSRSRPTAIKPA